MKPTHTLILLAVLTGCRLLERPTPQQQVAELLAEHPELTVPETVRVQVPVVLPAAEARVVYRPSPADSARHVLDVRRLDSLLRQAEVSLDSVQRRAATRRVREWVHSRPVPLDTLCFDTLGVRGRVWYQSGGYQLQLVRKALRTTAPAQVVRQQLRPCPPAPHYAWYQPAGWPWWWVFVAGAAAGVVCSYALFNLSLRALR
ncbi:hypothetical protein [Hymenobacter sp. CRA2]|uniref:hypothetical protein n=1 Tax=Hymenobacter sp. CRA2 TaxID=1955620 RepID=UPI00098EE293|nr:hypothetical protein [Hymenobacter sp. CRA2]OON67818.1 hypothetical protein B0919_16670 [Hymenobacter sp. CRA2]